MVKNKLKFTSPTFKFFFKNSVAWGKSKGNMRSTESPENVDKPCQLQQWFFKGKPLNQRLYPWWIHMGICILFKTQSLRKASFYEAEQSF